MTLWMLDHFAEMQRNGGESRPATRVDRLRADGWEDCALGVTDNDKGEWVHRADCPYGCVDGLVPPDWMVEAAAEGLHLAVDLEVTEDSPDDPPWPWYLVPAEIRDAQRRHARAALVAAAQAVKEHE